MRMAASTRSPVANACCSAYCSRGSIWAEQVLEQGLPHPAADLGRLEQSARGPRCRAPRRRRAGSPRRACRGCPAPRPPPGPRAGAAAARRCPPAPSAAVIWLANWCSSSFTVAERLAPRLVGLGARGLDVALQEQQRLVRLLAGRLERAEPRHRPPEGQRGDPDQQREGRHDDPRPRGASRARAPAGRASGGTPAGARTGAHTAASRRSRHWPDIRVWQSEKSYFTGSAGSSERSRAVISSAIFQFRLRRRVRPSERAMFSMCVSTGISSAAGGIVASRGRSPAARGGPSSAGRGAGACTARRWTGAGTSAGSRTRAGCAGTPPRGPGVEEARRRSARAPGPRGRPPGEKPARKQAPSEPWRIRTRWVARQKAARSRGRLKR